MGPLLLRALLAVALPAIAALSAPAPPSPAGVLADAAADADAPPSPASAAPLVARHDSLWGRVITLERTPHRYGVFRANSRAHEVFPRLSKFAAIDGLELDLVADARISAYGRASILRGERRSHSGLATRGMAGLYVSHVDVWRAFLESGEPLGMVFEDDALVRDDGGAALDEVMAEMPADPDTWDVDLWLLGVVAVLEERPASRLFGPGWTRVTNFFGTQAYMLTRRGAQRLVQHAYPMTDQIDAYMARMAALGEVVAVYRADRKVNFPQFVFGPLAGVWSTVQQAYCDTCNLPADWSRSHDEAGWRRVGAAIGAVLALAPWVSAGLLALLAAAIRRPRLLCCGGSSGGGSVGGGGDSGVIDTGDTSNDSGVTGPGLIGLGAGDSNSSGAEVAEGVCDVVGADGEGAGRASDNAVSGEGEGTGVGESEEAGDGSGELVGDGPAVEAGTGSAPRSAPVAAAFAHAPSSATSAAAAAAASRLSVSLSAAAATLLGARSKKDVS